MNLVIEEKLFLTVYLHLFAYLVENFSTHNDYYYKSKFGNNQSLYIVTR